ncbi:MAG: hypothetical protein WCQ78_01615 [Actinomycetes bacterium]
MLINHFQHLANASLHMINQEDGAMPGKGLTPIMAVLYFIVAPIALFLVISGIAYLGTADRKAKRSDLTHIL